MRFCLTFREEPRHMQIWHIELSSFATERVLAVSTRFRPMQLPLKFWMRFGALLLYFVQRVGLC